MRPEAIDSKTKSVLEKIGKEKISAKFYLAGETALAIQLGHRKSIDLDFFSSEEFSVKNLKGRLSRIGEFALDCEEERTLSGSLDCVKISFFRYNYDLLFPFLVFAGVNLADERDIAAMKIDAISSRGSKKDFVDLCFILQKYSLSEILNIFKKKYSGIKYNTLHILKSLVYFDDAENEPMPKMLAGMNWEEIKEDISRQVKSFQELK